MAVDGRWRGTTASYTLDGRRSDAGEGQSRPWDKPSEKITVPTFDGEAGVTSCGVSSLRQAALLLKKCATHVEAA